jgi:glutathione S-transferase
VITIYDRDTSRSERIACLREELDLEYRLERHHRQPSGAAPDALKAIHPLGKAPIVR